VIRGGLCSVTLRALAAADVVRIAAAAGLEGIEWGADVHVPPGDLSAAESVRAATEQAGLRATSYGSYYRAGHDDPANFGAALSSARALGAPRIRVWAGARGSAGAGARERAAVSAALRRAADQAADAGIQIALEFHGGTLTDDVDSTLQLLEEGGVATYWQPPEGVADEEALAGLRRLLDRVTAVHVFSWWPGRQRRPLAARERLWRRAFALLAPRGSPLDALLEFVPGDDPALVAGEARTLRRLVEEAGHLPA
jgi:3-dehydroshikimate dehydratase